MEQVGEAICTESTTFGPIEGSEVQNLSSGIPDSDNVKIDDTVRKTTNAVQPLADGKQNVSEHAEGASNGKSNTSTSREFNVVEDKGLGEKVPEIGEVIKTENEDMDNESLNKDAEEKEKVKVDESGKYYLDKVDMENLFVEDTSGKKVFEIQVQYNNKEDEFVDLESAAMTEHVNCIVENLISSIGQDSTVVEPCQTIANLYCTRRLRRKGVRLTNAQRQKAYRQRHGAAYRIKERERKRRSYVPAHLRPPEVLEAQRERARIYKRLYDRRRKLTGSGLNTISSYHSQQSSSSNNDSGMPVEGSFSPEASIVKTSATKTSTKGPSKNVRRANFVGRHRPNKRKQANTVDHITEEPKTFNKKMKSCILNSSKVTPMSCNKKNNENKVKRIEKTLPCGTKGKSVNSFPKSPIQSVRVPTQVDHKLDLSSINYLELVKLRDACNYYISQYENMFLQQMNLRTALQQNNAFLNDDYYDSDDDVEIDNNGVDDHNDDDDDIDLSSDTEDSGYSGKSLKKKNVKKTQQVSAASLVNRTQQVSAASLVKITQKVSEDSLVKKTQKASAASLVKRTQKASEDSLVKKTQEGSGNSLVKRTQQESSDSLVNRTEQVSGDCLVKRSKRLKLKRDLKMNQNEMDDTNKDMGRKTNTMKQRKLQREKNADLSKNLPNFPVSSSKTNTNKKRNDKGLSTSQQENHMHTLNLNSTLNAVVKLEPIDQDDELLNNVLVNLDLSASVDQTRNCRHYPHYKGNDFGLDKPRSPRAIIQKRYRERKKAKLGALYMEQERLRSRQYYIPVAMMSNSELKKRREKSRLHTRAHRLRKKLHEMLETGNSEGQV